MSVDMDVVGVMAAYSARGACVYTHARTTGKYCIRLPEDGCFVIRNMLEHF